MTDALNVPTNLYYTKEHEWVEFITDDKVRIGITDFAQNALGEVVYVELPDEGTELKKDETFGVVESIKSVSDLFAPLSGKVSEKNAHLEDNPEDCKDAYGQWMLEIELSNPSEKESLLSAEDYQKICAEQG